MTLAYAVVLVSDEFLKQQKREVMQRAQAEADRKFEKIAQDNLLTRVTRNPEPRTMTPEECHRAFPWANLEGLTGLYFTADIT